MGRRAGGDDRGAFGSRVRRDADSPLEFKVAVPSAETAERILRHARLHRALDFYDNSFRAPRPMRSARASRRSGPNGIVIFSGLMDASSLFLTADADTVYCVGAIDLSDGPMVIKQPSVRQHLRALPTRFYARIEPTPVARPRLIKLNRRLAGTLTLDPGDFGQPRRLGGARRQPCSRRR